MIKAAGKMKDGRPLLLLGLSYDNLSRLMTDQPVKVDTAELKASEPDNLPSMVVVIFAGKTEEAMLAQLREHVEIAREL